MKGIEKLKGYISVKLAAWAAITLCGIIFAGSVFAIFCFIDTGVYEKTEEEMRQKMIEAANERYSVQALSQMIQNIDINERINAFSDTEFRYGIIKADSLEGIDLNDPEVYIERNFTQKAALENLYTQEWVLTPETTFQCARTIFDDYNIYIEDVPAPEYTGILITDVVYDIVGGIIYYECGREYYPVRNVMITFYDEERGSTVLLLAYDDDWHMYRNLGAEAMADTSLETYGIDYCREQWMQELAAADESGTTVEQLMRQPYMTFDMLDDTDCKFDSWNGLRLDGKFRDPKELALLSVGALEGADITETSDYYFEEKDGKLYINETVEVLPESYWVVSILPEYAGVDLNSSDMFVQADTVVSIVYMLRYTIYVIFLLALGSGILLLAFLIRAAGYRKGSAEIAKTWVDRIPLDIYLCAAGMAEVTMLILLSEIGYNLEQTYPLCGLIILLMFWLALLSVLTLAVRSKTECIWRNTVIYRILRWIGKGAGFVMRNLPVFGQALLILAIVFCLDLLLTVLLYMGSLGVLLWLLEKAVIAALVLGVVYQLHTLMKSGEKLAEGDLKYQINTDRMFWIFKEHAENLNRIGEGMSLAVEERMKSERFKTELITNVSHDIKTPLTSIINYVDLLEKEELNNENAAEYLDVLERQSERLKKLIQDLIDSSKAASGSLPVSLEKLEAGVFLVQTAGEFEEKINANQLELIIQKPEKEVYIVADGKYFWRVIDNLMNNICKYAQPSTRVYINMEEKEGEVFVIFRNTSKYPLNISSEELMERFVRGDSSRHTEGSGLGISIAKSLMELMGGAFHLSIDGDLFKVELVFPVSV